MPAKAGIQNHLKILGSRLRGNDAKGSFKTFYEAINIKFRLTQVRGGSKIQNSKQILIEVNNELYHS